MRPRISIRGFVRPSVGPLVGNPFFLLRKNGGKWSKMTSHLSAVFLFQPFALILSFNLPFTIFLSQSFFHNLSFTILLSQSFFHNLSFTIFFSQSLFSIFAFPALVLALVIVIVTINSGNNISSSSITIRTLIRFGLSAEGQGIASLGSSKIVSLGDDVDLRPEGEEARAEAAEEEEEEEQEEAAAAGVAADEAGRNVGPRLRKPNPPPNPLRNPGYLDALT